MPKFSPREQFVHAIQLIPANIPEICNILLNHLQVKKFNLNYNPELEIPLTLDVTFNTNDPLDWWEVTRNDWIVYVKDRAEILGVYEDTNFRDIFNVEDVT